MIFNVGIILVIDDADAQRMNEVSSVNISIESGGEFIIDPKFILDLDESAKVYSNNVTSTEDITFASGEIINIEYKSPCGFPDSIEGIFLDGVTDIGVKGFSEKSGTLELVKFSGEQHQFYVNPSPEKEGIDTINIPNNLEKKNYELVFVMDCDEEIIYYSTFAEIT
ncbi:MAG: hypothetical protein ACPKPY_11850 [Nitrososphaeraceae archaeon]